MKLVKKYVDKHGRGSIQLIPEVSEDMWHAYNLIIVGDSVESTTIRKVQSESATGSSSSQRIRTTLKICVEAIDFDTQAGVLRLKGRTIAENQHVRFGSYHTLDLELNRKFTIEKEEWDSIAMERVTQACDFASTADLGAIVMQEGVAHVCLISDNMTSVRFKVEVPIPRKRLGSSTQHDNALKRFYDVVMQSVLRHIDFNVVKCCLIASPGFVRDQFFKHMFEQAVKEDIKVLMENRDKFMLVHSSSGFLDSLKEVFNDPIVMAKVKNTKAAEEVQALDLFYKTLEHNADKAFYGKKHVFKAAEALAIDKLLISDNLFRSNNVADRKQYVELVESVKNSGAEVKIFSSMHISGEQLSQLTGLAAILRYPMPELEDEDDDDDDDDNNLSTIHKNGTHQNGGSGGNSFKKTQVENNNGGGSSSSSPSPTPTPLSLQTSITDDKKEIKSTTTKKQAKRKTTKPSSATTREIATSNNL